ncbi:MAG TPA: MATE family efflux transporter [Rhodopila sp.]|uniref:MATE family efflux transporter n=1 Tax=Rhodopila sp. TaxID=2480087 RepID=UPI002C73DA79|nr:MATE family efflux transporter [Rhodopila sp.]HVY18415.1 MATE family efflux transporter [Rhodopila sp.]
MRPFTKEWVTEARALGGISVSVTITMLAQLVISAVETLAVARLGITVLAGVTLALSIYLLIFLFALGVVTAVTPIAAQACGRNDEEGVRLAGQHALWVGLTFSLPGTVFLLGGAILLRLHGVTSEATATADYLIGAAWGLPAWVCYVAVRSLAVATGRVNVTTAVMLAAVPLHAGLTWWLVFGGLGLPPLGATGAGLAYSLAAVLAWGLLVIIVRASSSDAFSRSLSSPFTWQAQHYQEIVRLGIPFACRIVLREGVLPAAAFIVAPFGASAVAAHAVAARIVDLLGVFSFGFSDAANTRAGVGIGAGNLHQVSSAGWVSVQLSAAVNVPIVILLLSEPARLASWFLGSADHFEIVPAAAVLPVAACVLILEGIQSAIGGALSGMRDAKGPLFIAVLGFWGVGLPVGFLLAHKTAVPALGVWIGLLFGACAATLLHVIRFRRRLRRLQEAAARAADAEAARPCPDGPFAKPETGAR